MYSILRRNSTTCLAESCDAQSNIRWQCDSRVLDDCEARLGRWNSIEQTTVGQFVCFSTFRRIRAESANGFVLRVLPATITHFLSSRPEDKALCIGMHVVVQLPQLNRRLLIELVNWPAIAAAGLEDGWMTQLVDDNSINWWINGDFDGSAERGDGKWAKVRMRTTLCPSRQTGNMPIATETLITMRHESAITSARSPAKSPCDIVANAWHGLGVKHRVHYISNIVVRIA